jgi:glycosyltransferase involved in cell wall biosynthesis
MFTVAIQYPSFGPQHPSRLEAIAKASPYPEARIVAMEMFKKDSDYEWAPITYSSNLYERYTVMDCESAVARKHYFKLRSAVFSALDEIKPDVLVVNGWGHRESRISIHWCRKHGVKMVLLSDSVRENTNRFWPKELAKKWVIRDINAAFVAGTPQARYVEYLGIPKNNIFYPGSCVVDNDYWQKEAIKARENQFQLRRKFNLPERYFLCVSRFVKLKNLPFVLKAYAEYQKLAGTNSFGLVLCGSGPEEPKIKSLIKKLNLINVCLPGFIQYNHLPVFFALASCFVFPSSHFEAWGLVANEAMACGLPVLVSYKCGCAEDLVKEGVNGYTFDPRDQTALANLMLKISKDEITLSTMGRESEKLISEHSCRVGAMNLWKAIQKAF